MSYYTPTGNPASLSRGVSTLIRAEFALIAAGLTQVLSDMGLAAPIQVTAGRALASGDNGRVITCTSASLETFTLGAGLTSGFHCAIVQGGVGQVTVTASVATLVNVDGEYKSAGTGAILAILNTDTNAYSLGGNTAP